MPIYPELQEQDSSQPLDLSKVTFPLVEQFTSAASNAYWKYQTNQFIGNIENLTEHTNDPAFEPMTASDLDALKVDRPELKIPAGTSKFVASMMASMYDNDKHLGLVAQSNSKNMGKIGAFGAAIAGMAGSMAGALANPKAAIYGLAAAPAGRLIGATIAEKAIGSLGARELYGSASARIGTLLAEKSGEGALASVGFELENQRAEQQRRTVLEEPHEYLQSLQNIGEAGLFGAAFGLGLGAIGIGLRGRPVMRLADGTFIDKPPTGKAGVDENGQPWVAGQEGGLLNRPEFRNMGDTAKDYISRIYKPWSKDADITMREEATGQMYNGQEVNIDPVLKQGIADGGAEFRTGIANHNNEARARQSPTIEIQAFDRQLAEAQENIVSEMFVKHFAEKDALAAASEKILYRGRSDNTFGFKSLEQAGVTERSLRKADHELGKGYWYSETKEHAQTYGKVVEEARGNFKILDLTKDIPENVDLQALYDKIHSQSRDLTKLADTQQKIKEFRQAVKDAGYQGVRRFGVVGKDAGRYEVMFFEKPKSPQQLAKEAEAARLSNLQEQYNLAQSMRDHLTDTNEPLSDSEVKDYSEHLKTPGLRDNGYTTDVPREMEGFTTDDYLAEFPDKEINKTLETIGEKSDIAKEINITREKLKQQPTFEKMVTELSDCILKGGL